MKTGTARYAKHYEIAAYGESAVRWGYNHWWGKTFLLGFSANTFNNLGRTTKADIACGWGLTEGARSDIRYRNITPKGLSQNKEARINPKSSLFSHSSHALRHPRPQGNPSSYSPSNKALFSSALVSTEGFSPFYSFISALTDADSSFFITTGHLTGHIAYLK